MNDINFPAGILQPPFFDRSQDDAVNYGSVGSVIGHELTHGFDDEGRQFDGKGNFEDWWTPADSKQFTERADCVVNEFNGFVAVDDLHVNGKLTLGENLADLGGLKLAFLAYLDRAQKGGVDLQQKGGGVRWLNSRPAVLCRVWTALVRKHPPGGTAIGDRNRSARAGEVPCQWSGVESSRVPEGFCL